MRVSEIDFQLPCPPDEGRALKWLADRTKEKLPVGQELVRLVITESNHDFYNCEATTYQAGDDAHLIPTGMALEFRKRQSENAGRFNVVMLVPTGIGASI